MNKRKNIVTIIIITISIVAIILGLGLYTTASLPIQDPELAPASVLLKQSREIVLGKFLIALGGGSIIWRLGVIKKEKKERKEKDK